MLLPGRRSIKSPFSIPNSNVFFEINNSLSSGICINSILASVFPSKYLINSLLKIVKSSPQRKIRTSGLMKLIKDVSKHITSLSMKDQNKMDQW